MKKLISIIFILSSLTTLSQVDYSDSWEDFYSYNNVKDFYIDSDKIYAVCDNAIFIYNANTSTYKKISSVHGLSGGTISSFLYSKSTSKIMIGYENGIIEVVNPNGSIKVSDDIDRLNISGSKRINSLTQFNNIVYVATSFGIIEYDIENLAFGDTFYIGNQSTTVNVNQITVLNNTIFAATETGVYFADVNNPNLIDFNNWQQPEGNFIGNFKAIEVFNNKVYASKNSKLYFVNQSNVQEIRSFPTDIINLNSSSTLLNITLEQSSYTLNSLLQQVGFINTTTDYDFKLHNSFTIDNTTYLATKRFGILKNNNNQPIFEEIHPEGPLFNDSFSIEILNNNLWVVYGGKKFSSFNPAGISKGISHFNGENWINFPYPNQYLSADLLDISIDKNYENKVYVSTFYGGIIEIENDEILERYNHNNSGLEKNINNYTSVSSSAFDSQGNLWIANGYVSDKVKKWDINNVWTGYNFNEVLVDSETEGLGDLIIDKNDNKWIETRANGVLVLNRDGTKTKALNGIQGNGNLPSNMIKALAVDKNNRIWIGTLKGLVRFDNTSSLFESDNYNARQIIIKLEGGTDENQGQVLLGEQPITAIAVDGADNKWFGTVSGGVLGTNPSGQKTLHIFNTENSPLPSNFINKIKVDDTTGKVYFATTKGIVVFNNKVAPFGDKLDETYAYPNPCTKEYDFITIDGRKGTHLPRGTNVKILDSAGYLVYETNVLEGIEVKGGKAIWNKRNLAGRKVASGVYIIMLSLPDKSETSITKVAIIN